jgi:hypothetical protein
LLAAKVAGEWCCALTEVKSEWNKMSLVCVFVKWCLVKHKESCKEVETKRKRKRIKERSNV